MAGPGPLLAVFAGLCAFGAALACLLPQRRQPAALAWLGSAAATAVLVASGQVLFFGKTFSLQLWPVLSLGRLALAMDALSAFFVFVLGLVFLAVSVFSASYLTKYAATYSLRYFGLAYYGFFASLVLVPLASDVLTFIVAWEVMSLISYLLVNFEHESQESMEAGLLMIAMSEAGAIAVVVALAVLVNAGGTLGFDGIRAAAPALGAGMRFSVFLLVFFGFGVKAGLLPVNSWLPRAHPAAPTNVSALLSGVMVNLGIYGILRFDADLVPPHGAGYGLLVLAFGSASALVGILYATIQFDLKRMLAHSTIENMGIVTAALGAGMAFSAAGLPALAAIALIASLYHLINHSLYKTLLFIGTGAVESGAGSRDLDRLGGLVRHMPWTAAFAFIGVWSIASLPPSNGFVSEWLTLQAILRSAEIPSAAAKTIFALSGAALALTAGLAVTCFVKAFAMGFLGIPRSQEALKARDPAASTRASLAIIAGLCVLLGLAPTFAIPVIDKAVVPIAHASGSDALVPPFFTTPRSGGNGMTAKFVSEFHDLGAQIGHHVVPGRGLVVLHQGGARNPVVFAMSTSYGAIVLAALVGLAALAFQSLTHWKRAVRSTVWAGGLRRLLGYMTYTATGFSNPVRVIFGGLFQPVAVEDRVEAVATHFRMAIRRKYSDDLIVDRLVLRPVIRAIQRASTSLRRMHAGPVNSYAAYVLLTIVVVLVVGRTDEISSLFLQALGIPPG